MEYHTEENGTQYWYKNGMRHREDGPAVIYPDGQQEWYKDGNIHREDGPAFSFGEYEMWYENDKFVKSNAMDFGIEHYMTNVVPLRFISDVNYEVFNMIIGITVYRKLPSKTIYRNCIINFDVCNYDDKFIDCVLMRPRLKEK